MSDDVIYLDNNATTATDPRVVEAICEVMRSGPLNPSSQHRRGRDARRRLDDAIDSIGRNLQTSFGVPGGPTLLITSGGTESNNLAIAGIGPPQAPLVISHVEHASVLEAARTAETSGREVRRIPVDRDGVVDLDALASRLTVDGRHAGLVSLMSANNETGVQQPIERAAEICRDGGVPLHVDATQSIGKVPVDLNRWGASAVTITPHKCHGPVGVGGLWLASGITPTAILHGGEQQLEIRPGTEPLALVVGMAESLRLAATELDESANRMRRLRDRLEQGLLERHPDIVVHGHGADRIPSTSCLALLGSDRQSMLMTLDLAGVACSTGSACSSGSNPPSHVLTAMGVPRDQLDSSLRFGVSKFSTDEEIERAIDVISRIYRKLGSPRKVEI